MKRVIGMVLLLMLCATSLQAQEITPPDPTTVALVPVAEGFDRPLYLTSAGDGSGRLFVLEQSGNIWIVRDGQRLDSPFLDVSELMSQDVFGGGYSERGGY